jgi:hypothetical protein
MPVGTPFAPSLQEVRMEDSKKNNRRPEGKEGAGAHQEGSQSVQAGQTQRGEQSAPESSPKTGRSNKPSKDQRNK